MLVNQHFSTIFLPRHAYMAKSLIFFNQCSVFRTIRQCLHHQYVTLYGIIAKFAMMHKNTGCKLLPSIFIENMEIIQGLL